MSNLQKLISDFQPLTAIIVAIAGGFTSFLMDKDYTLTKFFISVVSAGFAGYLVYCLGVECGLKENTLSVLCGISGLSGEAVVRVFKKISLEYLKEKIKIKESSK